MPVSALATIDDEKDEEDGEHLRHRHHPARDGGAVDQLVHLAVALAPHELAAVEGRDQQQEDRRPAADRGDRRGDGRVVGGAVARLARNRTTPLNVPPREDQDDEARAGQDLTDLDAKAGQELGGDRRRHSRPMMASPPS